MHLRAFILAVGFAAIPLFAQQPPPPGLSPEVLQQLLKQYPDADANKDGTLTAEEARAYREKTRGSRPPGVTRSGSRRSIATPATASNPGESTP